MHHDATVWHYIAAFVIFMAFGGVAHVCRAVFNVFPDRLSDRPMMDMMISDGYNLGDAASGTEYDDAGYYKLDSWRNLRNSMLCFAFGGMLMMLFADKGAEFVAFCIDTALVWLWQLFLYRIETITLV